VSERVQIGRGGKPHGIDGSFFIEQSSEDLYAAIDQLMDKLDRQVCRYKDKVQDHHHAAAKRIDTSPV